MELVTVSCNHPAELGFLLHLGRSTDARNNSDKEHNSQAVNELSFRSCTKARPSWFYITFVHAGDDSRPLFFWIERLSLPSYKSCATLKSSGSTGATTIGEGMHRHSTIASTAQHWKSKLSRYYSAHCVESEISLVLNVLICTTEVVREDSSLCVEHCVHVMFAQSDLGYLPLQTSVNSMQSGTSHQQLRRFYTHTIGCRSSTPWPTGVWAV
eukprot:4035519-Amphidinium_carterae.1